MSNTSYSQAQNVSAVYDPHQSNQMSTQSMSGRLNQSKNTTNNVLFNPSLDNTIYQQSAKQDSAPRMPDQKPYNPMMHNITQPFHNQTHQSSNYSTQERHINDLDNKSSGYHVQYTGLPNNDPIGQQTTQMPLIGQKTTQMPPIGQQTTQMPPMGQQTTQMPPMGQQTTQMPPIGQQTTQMPPIGQQTTQMPPIGQQSTQMPSFGQQTTQMPPIGQQTTQMPPFGQQTTQMPPIGQQTTQMPPIGQQTTQMPPIGQQTYQMPPKSQQGGDFFENDGNQQNFQDGDQITPAFQGLTLGPVRNLGDDFNFDM